MQMSQKFVSFAFYVFPLRRHTHNRVGRILCLNRIARIKTARNLSYNKIRIIVRRSIYLYYAETLEYSEAWSSINNQRFFHVSVDHIFIFSRRIVRIKSKN